MSYRCEYILEDRIRHLITDQRQCSYKIKATVKALDFEDERRVCGIHRNLLIRRGWIEIKEQL